MRATAGVLVTAAGLLGLVLGSAGALAGDKAFDHPTGESAGNWSRSKSVEEVQGSSRKAAKPGKKAAATASDDAVPIPRPKPGSKAAQREEAARKKAADAEAKDDAKKKETAKKEEPAKKAESNTPTPKPKPKKEDDKPVQAGLVAETNDSDAPYRGSLDKDEIKAILSGKTIASRIDGKDARITLGNDGRLSWSAGGMSGVGFWWTEKGRVCDRYDPSGDFAGRGAGCRSFEQRGGDYYTAGKKLQLLN